MEAGESLLGTKNLSCVVGPVYDKVAMHLCTDMEFRSEEKCSIFSDKGPLYTILQTVSHLHPICGTLIKTFIFIDFLTLGHLDYTQSDG